MHCYKKILPHLQCSFCVAIVGFLKEKSTKNPVVKTGQSVM